MKETRIRSGYEGADSMRERARKLMGAEMDNTPMESPKSKTNPNNDKMRMYKKGGSVKPTASKKNDGAYKVSKAPGQKYAGDLLPRVSKKGGMIAEAGQLHNEHIPVRTKAMSNKKAESEYKEDYVKENYKAGGKVASKTRAKITSTMRRTIKGRTKRNDPMTDSPLNKESVKLKRGGMVKECFGGKVMKKAEGGKIAKGNMIDETRRELKSMFSGEKKRAKAEGQEEVVKLKNPASPNMKASKKPVKLANGGAVKSKENYEAKMVGQRPVKQSKAENAMKKGGMAKKGKKC